MTIYVPFDLKLHGSSRQKVRISVFTRVANITTPARICHVGKYGLNKCAALESNAGNQRALCCSFRCWLPVWSQTRMMPCSGYFICSSTRCSGTRFHASVMPYYAARLIHYGAHDCCIDQIGPLTAGKVDAGVSVASYVQAALRFQSKCYSLWQVAFQVIYPGEHAIGSCFENLVTRGIYMRQSCLHAPDDTDAEQPNRSSAPCSPRAA